MVKTPMHLEIQVVMHLVDLDSTSPSLNFYNSVTVDSDDHLVDGKTGGARVFENREPCVQRVITPLLDFLSGRRWVDAVESRWTNVGVTARRLLVGVAAANTLPTALEQVKIGLALDDSLEQSFVHIIAHDKNDLSAKNRLRLLRLTRTLCRRGIATDIATIIVTSTPIDAAHYAILGSGPKKDMAGLAELVHQSKSLVVACQASFDGSTVQGCRLALGVVGCRGH